MLTSGFVNVLIETGVFIIQSVEICMHIPVRMSTCYRISCFLVDYLKVLRARDVYRVALH
jgi:uncharacterized membrane protein YozB (DUF420 family)